jgi:23S rRNA (cytosine1962-C5)-methyltransferase
MRASKNWQDYQIIDAGDKEKLEKIKNTVIRRPDPVAIWHQNPSEKLWKKTDATYHRSSQGGGEWKMHQSINKKIHVNYDDMTFICSLTDFKHIGLFPEQATNWDFIKETIQASNRKNLKVLNLFAYTGAATVACARLDQVDEVVHVDASKGMNQWAKDNLALNHLTHKKVRFLSDDVNKFVAREIRREHTYDIIILDPPSYGRGPNNEVWKIDDDIMNLLTTIKQLLSKQPMFVVLNSYTSSLSPTMVFNIMDSVFEGGSFLVDEIGIQYANSDRVLPAGVTGIWQASK